MRWRSLLVLGLSMCELEVMEGTMGHLFGLVTPLPLLYGSSPFWVICFLIQKKNIRKNKEGVSPRLLKASKHTFMHNLLKKLKKYYYMSCFKKKHLNALLCLCFQ